MNINEVEIKSIIQDLKLMNEGVGVDGETMQYILEQVGMEWQMLRQLVLTMPMAQIKYLIKERENLFGQEL